MKIDIITIFPSMFDGVFAESIVKRAQNKGKCEIQLHDLRKWTTDRHRSVDDKPYGGGAGMIMKVEPLEKALREISCHGKNSDIVLLSPKGSKFDQGHAKKLATREQLLLICGHYGGVDERVRSLVSLELSIGDFILTCGEIPAMAVTDAVVRLLPGVLGDCRSLENESFEGGLLEAPRYTRPSEYKGMKVPEVLLSGDPVKIKKWETEKRIEMTRDRRPDLM